MGPVRLSCPRSHAYWHRAFATAGGGGYSGVGTAGGGTAGGGTAGGGTAGGGTAG
ncbi:MAG: hypothetical protein QOE84_898, partial [Actinomycetota bacterium]|nr:hypothetical protein [Actinomycetota bacterium]